MTTDCGYMSTSQNISETIGPKKLTVLDKETIMMESLIPFYKHKYNLQQIIDLVEGKTKVSLRLVDWFIINYSKKYDTCFNIQKDGKIGNVLVHVEYKSHLKAYTKKHFDVFKRYDPISLEYYDKNENTVKYFKTTIGQLNIFRWIIKRKILDYVSMYYDQINDDMNIRLKEAKNRKRKTRLSVSIAGSMNQHKVELLATFKDGIDSIDSIDSIDGIDSIDSIDKDTNC